MVVLAVTAAILVVLVLLWVRQRKEHFKFFKKLGINGPEPNFFFGNLMLLAFKEPHICQLEWSRKYGDTYGFFLGWRPTLVTSDPEFLKLIQIKESQNFINRDLIMDKGGTPLEYTDISVIFAQGKDWKLMRTILNPTFTSGKIKQLTPLMRRSIDELISKLRSLEGDELEVTKTMGLLTLDNIFRAAFGTDARIQADNNLSLYNLLIDFTDGRYYYATYIIAFSFPAVGQLLLWIMMAIDGIMKFLGKNSLRNLIDTILSVLEERKTSPLQEGRKDFLQLMLDAKAEEQDLKEINDAIGSQNLRARLTQEEIIGNSLLFLIAGQDTTSALLSFTCYALATHQDVQERLRKEILNLIGSQRVPDYSDLQKSTYLDQVVRESLRLYPPVISFANRKAMVDFEYGGVRYPKGLTIQIPVFSLHRDPRHWEHPDSFRPERFAPENKEHLTSMVYQPFGEGPRNCIGSRFALTFAKLTLVVLLQNFRISHPHPVSDQIELDNLIFLVHPEPYNLKFTALQEK